MKTTTQREPTFLERRLGSNFFRIDVTCDDGFGGVTDGAVGMMLRRAADRVDEAQADAVFIDAVFESDDTTATLKLYFEERA